MSRIRCTFLLDWYDPEGLLSVPSGTILDISEPLARQLAVQRFVTLTPDATGVSVLAPGAGSGVVTQGDETAMLAAAAVIGTQFLRTDIGDAPGTVYECVRLPSDEVDEDGHSVNWQAHSTGSVGSVIKVFTYAQVLALENNGLLSSGNWYSPSDQTNPRHLAFAQRVDDLVWWLSGEPSFWGAGTFAARPTSATEANLSVGDTYRVTDAQTIKDYTWTPIEIVGDIDHDPASALITGIADTSIVAVGMSITGTGIPEHTTILSIDSATQVTLSANVTVTAAAGTFLVRPRSITANNTSGQTTLTSCLYTTGLSADMEVFGPGIYAGTTIDSVDSATQITLSAATFAGSTGGTYRFLPEPTIEQSAGGVYEYCGATRGWKRVAPHILVSMRSTVGVPLVSVTGATSYASSNFPRVALPADRVVPGDYLRLNLVWERGGTNATAAMQAEFMEDGVADNSAHRVADVSFTASDGRGMQQAIDLRVVTSTAFFCYGTTSFNVQGGGENGINDYSTDVDFAAEMVVAATIGSANAGDTFRLIEIEIEVI